jgi:putative transposase
VRPLVGASPFSQRQIEQMMDERGVVVDHATIHRWSIKMLPFWLRCLAGASPRSARVGEWARPIRRSAVSGTTCTGAADRAGHPIDFLLRAHCDLVATRSFFERAIALHGVPEKITIDKSGAKTAAIVGMCANSSTRWLCNPLPAQHLAGAGCTNAT